MLPKHPYTNFNQAPKGYFESLPDKIIQRRRASTKKMRQIWLAASLSAAMVLLGVFFWNQDEIPYDNFDNNLSTEINFYINSDYWQAEDILNLSDNPNQLLDDLIASEWDFFDDYEDDEFDEFWF
ncbi:hypothetical protein [Mongoliitalea lutea]|uniref:Uncharacterized protein n=1 Tax=Mongoliitalea lutea TaxID=849756 RepID=A0A8J3CZK7_9BACT|nr:hypothetical protein [Mongoliitalea lutea]GHB49279.1 hypothetical protein GCM10008106_32610 [Mongoliitalea lutea]